MLHPTEDQHTGHDPLVPVRAWNPDWDQRKAGKDCQHCLMIKSPQHQPRGLLVYEGDYVTGLLARSGSIRGYTIAVFNRGHACELHDLHPDDLAGYWLEVAHLAAAIAAAVRPVKMNYETLGNAVPHLHTHIIPRLQLDPAPHEPMPGWCFTTGQQPETDLQHTARQIRDQLTAIGARPQ